MKKSIKKQTSKAFQIGGVINPSNQNTGIYQVPGTGISGFQQPPAVTTGFTPNQPIQSYCILTLSSSTSRSYISNGKSSCIVASSLLPI